MFAIDRARMAENDETDATAGAPSAATRASPLERLASFRFAYGAIFAFLVAYAFSVEGVERLLFQHFSDVTEVAVRVDPADGPVADQIHARIAERIAGSRWVRYGDVRVRPLVVAADGHTAIFAGIPIPLLPRDTEDLGEHLLPATVAHVDVSVPHNSLLANLILVSYAAMLVTVLAVYTRRLTDREQAALEALTLTRDNLAGRAEQIESELGSVRQRLGELEPENELYAEEVDVLGEERSALEELLEEATEDLSSKEAEIEELRHQVKRTNKGRSSREDDLLERRFRTLYKNLEVDEHAISDLVALRDESLKLRAEEAIKRLSDEPEQAVVRRKLGGLPPHLSIFELAFAGKGRIYYTKGTARRFRILSVGAKNTQKADLDYLARLPKGT